MYPVVRGVRYPGCVCCVQQAAEYAQPQITAGLASPIRQLIHRPVVSPFEFQGSLRLPPCVEAYMNYIMIGRACGVWFLVARE